MHVFSVQSVMNPKPAYGAGADGTKLGVRVKCWACPHDGRNLPANCGALSGEWVTTREKKKAYPTATAKISIYLDSD
jgi:hypothetical protein